jgi:hypothetical protein
MFFVILIIRASPIKNTAILKELPESYPLKTGNAWVYHHRVYNPFKDIVRGSYDTVNIVGKYKDHYKLQYNNYEAIYLRNNREGKYISCGHIIRGDTVLYQKPQIATIFSADTGYIDQNALSTKYTFPSKWDSFHVSIKDSFNYKNQIIAVYVTSYISGCPGVYKRYKYYGKQGLIYYKAIGNDKETIVEERVLLDTLQNFYLDNRKNLLK